MASLQDIRAKYPQYNDMSDQDLADAMHQKFYSDMPKDDFYSKIGFSAEPEKPAPMSWPQVGVQALTHTPSSAYRFGADIAHAVAHPVDTAKAMGGLALGGLEKGYEGYGGGEGAKMALGAANPLQGLYNVGRGMGLYGDTGHGQAVEQAGEFFKDRYGGYENIKRTIAEDPVGVLGDISTIATGGEALPGRLGAMSAKVARATDPINIGLKAGEKLAQPFRSGATVGGRDIAKAFERDKLDTAKATAQGAEIAKDRPGMATLAHVGGEGVQGMVEHVAQTPGGRAILADKLVAEQRQQATRLGEDLRSLTGTTQTAVKAVEDAVAEQRTAASPAYKQAYGDGDRAIWEGTHPETQGVLERLSGAKDFRDAMAEAVTGWERTAIADGYGAMNPRAMVKNQMLQFQKGGIPTFPNLQFWDYTKHALDRMIQAEINEKTGRLSRKGAELTTIKNKLVGVLDKEVPSYAAARAKYAGPAQYMNAIGEGKELLNRTLTAEEVTNMMRDFSEADREGYRTGVVSSILQKMRSDPAKLADYTKYLRSEDMRDKIAAIMRTPEDAAKWKRRLDLEVKSSEMVGRALGGSATARRLFQIQDASMIGDLIQDAFTMHGRPTAVAWSAATKIPRMIRDHYRARADEWLAKLVSSPGALEHLDLAMSGGMPKRTPLLPAGAGAAARTAYGTVAPAARGAFQAGRLERLQDDAKKRLKDPAAKLSTDERQTLRSVARGTATLDQRQKADTFLQRYGGVQ